MRLAHKILIHIGGSALALALLSFIFIAYSMNSVFSEIHKEEQTQLFPPDFKSKVEERISKTIIITGVIMTGGLAVFFVLLLLLAKKIAAPLKEAVEFSNLLAKGDFSKKINRRLSHDEIGTLLKSLNFMCDRMQSYISKLERSHMREKTARKEAEKANHLKSDFLANMSLELRNPLNSIMGFSNIIIRETQEGKYDQELERKITTVYKSAEILNNLIASLLELSKLNSSEIKLNISDFMTDELIRELVSFNRLNAEEKNIALECHFSSDAPKKLRTDKDILFHVVSVIISSMVKSLPFEASVSFGCKTSGRSVIFWIKDSGCTEKTEPIADTYNKFISSQAETIPIVAGRLLLGLTIARANAGLLGADLQADSTPEGNSFFELIFNGEDIVPQMTTNTQSISRSTVHTATNIPKTIFTQEATRGKAPGTKVLIKENRATPGRTETGEIRVNEKTKSVLLAEDNEANRMLIQLLFRETAYDLECVPDGLACLDAIERGHYDILLLDLQMPKLDGYGVLKSLRNNPKYAGLPIVILTAYLEQNDKQKLILAGANECILKPIDLDMLSSTVRRLTED
ncbi:MAG: hypothetical protein A2020_01715 [Lentisphaerae bacterium GWF2_45_14]|nr:MAG: hypothetical protein A2020_01715 [Lentisphaerae bacterium GWF2_45_14]